VSAYDEALGVPTEAAARLALRTQQIVAYETDVLSAADPLGGSYEVEARTDATERRVRDVLASVQAGGGALACIESGWYARELAESAWRRTRAVESGERTVVGVNRFPAPTDPLEVFAVDPSAERSQVESVRARRAARDGGAVARALAGVTEAARGGDNVVPACVEAVTAEATVGEVVAALREVYGTARPSTAF
jgi:methylmalonyl-CoA mutase, N-terminal domain